jgi:hypothetical protein
MQMDQATLWQQFSALPEESRERVLELIAALAKQHMPLAEKARTDLMADPFIGMWRDRDDLADSSTWVRSSRNREWAPRSG